MTHLRRDPRGWQVLKDAIDMCVNTIVRGAMHVKTKKHPEPKTPVHSTLPTRVISHVQTSAYRLLNFWQVTQMI